MNLKRTVLSNGISVIDHHTEATKTILCIHGNSLESGLFEPVFNHRAFNDYRIIAPDLSGHGETGHSRNPEEEYSILNHMEVLKSLIGELNLENFVVFGHSLGGHLATNLIPETDQMKALAIMGTPPLTLPPKLEEAFLPNPDLMLAFKPDLSEEEKDRLCKVYIDPGSPYFDRVKSAIEKTDPLARAIIGKSIATDLYNDEKALIKNTSIPVAILHGEDDSLVNRDYLREVSLSSRGKDEVQIISNASHSAFLENTEEFCLKLREICEAQYK